MAVEESEFARGIAAVDRAIAHLEKCTLDKICRRKHFNDLVSAWWNIGTFSNRRAHAVKMMHSEGMQRDLASELERAIRCLKSRKKMCTIRLVLSIFNAYRYGLKVPDLDYTLVNKKIAQDLNTVSPWVQTANEPETFIPPSGLDLMIVFTWAASRVHGVQLGKGWTLTDMLNVVQARMRPYRIPSISMSKRAYLSTKDTTVMVLHVIYAIGEFGLSKVSPEGLEDEFEYCAQTLKVAAHFEDYEMVGEILDAFDVAGYEETRGGEKIDVSWARNLLWEKQNFDGTWGESLDTHRQYVCILGMMTRNDRGILRPLSSLAGQPMSYELYWETAQAMFSPKTQARVTGPSSAVFSSAILLLVIGWVAFILTNLKRKYT